MTGLDRDTSKSPDRTGVCCTGRCAPSQCETITGPSFSSLNKPDQERTPAYRDSSGSESPSGCLLCYFFRRLGGAIWGIPVHWILESHHPLLVNQNLGIQSIKPTKSARPSYPAARPSATWAVTNFVELNATRNVLVHRAEPIADERYLRSAGPHARAKVGKRLDVDNKYLVPRHGLMSALMLNLIQVVQGKSKLT